LLENRGKDDIILVDTNMHNYTVHLTNGLYLPPYHLDKDHDDKWLYYLGQYLMEFVHIKNVRQKIKTDFDLDKMFEESKQNQAFKKIQKSHEKMMVEIANDKLLENMSSDETMQE
jgi:hypothetical protein